MNVDTRSNEMMASGDVLKERYALREKIGRGGQGYLHLAQDLESGQLVAVKELDLGRVNDWKLIELFEREGEALAALSHPAIPDYVDAFHLDDSSGLATRFFLVQEYVTGESLAALIEDGLRFDEASARAFVEEVLEILVYLQGLSPPIIHRDIKPANIMRRADTKRLALIDFGGVQSTSGMGAGGSTVVGTSGYMPLEQFMGRAVEATDLYGLGATVVHLLSHRHPSDMGVDDMALDFRPYINVSATFSDYLARLLAPYLEDRFTSAREALLELQQLSDRIDSAGDSGAANRSEDLGIVFWKYHEDRHGSYDGAGSLDTKDFRFEPSEALSALIQRNPTVNSNTIVRIEHGVLVVDLDWVPAPSRYSIFMIIVTCGYLLLGISLIPSYGFCSISSMVILGVFVLFGWLVTSGWREQFRETLRVYRGGIELKQYRRKANMSESIVYQSSRLLPDQVKSFEFDLESKNVIGRDGGTIASYPAQGIVWEEVGGIRHTFGRFLVRNRKLANKRGPDLGEVAWIYRVIRQHSEDLELWRPDVVFSAMPREPGRLGEVGGDAVDA